MPLSTAIVWFRRDLRLTDNPALSYALTHHDRVIPLYLHTPDDAGHWAEGGASRWWLHHSLQALQRRLRDKKADLIIRQSGSAGQALQNILDETEIDAIYWNRLYTPWAIQRDKAIKRSLSQAGVMTQSFNAGLLLEPQQVLKSDGLPYKVFTAYWKQCKSIGILHSECGEPADIPYAGTLSGLVPDDLLLLPQTGWDKQFYAHWHPGEQHAHQRLADFLQNHVHDYDVKRDRPDVEGTSRLSPHLHFGEISPRTIINQAEACILDSPTDSHPSIHRLISEIGWREFAGYVLYHFPMTTEISMNPKFADFPWQQDDQALRRWQQGQTGMPIIDAGMRQLWQTGWMHNRVRMLVASFLTKNLRIHWQEGARWFWDTLLDADLASNSLGWQWVAGCGTDAAPYFRIFNPILQSRKFDPHGLYIRQWVPELSGLDNKQIHEPWLHQGRLDYPEPMVDLKHSREHALQVYRSLA